LFAARQSQNAVESAGGGSQCLVRHAAMHARKFDAPL
jgi:hypothetical protein